MNSLAPRAVLAAFVAGTMMPGAAVAASSPGYKDSLAAVRAGVRNGDPKRPAEPICACRSPVVPAESLSA